MKVNAGMLEARLYLRIRQSTSTNASTMSEREVGMELGHDR